MSDKELCSICCNEFTLLIYKKIECSFCFESVCRICVEKMLLHNAKDAKCSCPHCNNLWETWFIEKNMTAHFIRKKVIKKSAEMLFEKERLLIPQTLYKINNEDRIKELLSLIHI